MVKRMLRMCKRLDWIEQQARRMYGGSEFRTRTNRSFVKFMLNVLELELKAA